MTGPPTTTTVSPPVRARAASSDLQTTLRKLARIISRNEALEVQLADAATEGRANDPADEPARIEGDVLTLPAAWLKEPGGEAALVGRLDRLLARSMFSASAPFARLDDPLERALARLIDDRRCALRLIVSHPGAASFLRADRGAGQARARRRWFSLSWQARLLLLANATLWQEESPPPDDASVIPAWRAIRGALEQAADSADVTASIRHARRIATLLARHRPLALGMAMVSPGDDVADVGSEATSPRGDESERVARAPARRQPEGSDAFDPAEASDSDDPPIRTPTLPDGDQSEARGDRTLPPRSGTADELRRRLRSRLGLPLYSIPMSRDFDEVTDHSGQGDRTQWRALQRRALAATGQLADRLERLLRAEERQRWRFEQERGLINAAALSRLVTRPGYRTPFKLAEITPTHRVAVSLLIDLSASMTGERIEVARLCAAAMATALTRLDYPFEVLGFNSRPDARLRAEYQRREAAGEDLSDYNRLIERLDLHVYKSFASSALSGLVRMQCGQQNPDGEALAWAAGRLLEQRAPRHVMFVLSDGHPVTGDGDKRVLQTDLKLRITEARHAGIELVGIGIGDDAAAAYYDEAIVVRDLETLPRMAFSELSQMLLDPRGHTTLSPAQP